MIRIACSCNLQAGLPQKSSRLSVRRKHPLAATSEIHQLALGAIPFLFIVAAYDFFGIGIVVATSASWQARH